MTLGERIKKVRKEKDLTQQEFGKHIGIKPNSISLIESGSRNASEQVILSICREFNVNETWLRTGEGKMLIERPKNEVLATQIQAFLQGGTNSFRERLVSLLLRLAPEQWDALECYLIELMNAPLPSVPAPAVDFKMETATPSRPESDLVQKIAELERQNQELAAKVTAMEEEDKARGLWDGSSVSQSASAGSYNPMWESRRE